MKQRIDQGALFTIGQIEKDLSAFRGIRRLWARQTAGDEVLEYGNGVISADSLRQEQEGILWGMIANAMKLHSQMWDGEGEETPHTAYRRYPLFECTTCEDMYTSGDLNSETGVCYLCEDIRGIK